MYVESKHNFCMTLEISLLTLELIFLSPFFMSSVGSLRETVFPSSPRVQPIKGLVLSHLQQLQVQQ